jgi:hypothetical protein
MARDLLPEQTEDASLDGVNRNQDTQNGNRPEHSTTVCHEGPITRSAHQALSKHRDFRGRGSARSNEVQAKPRQPSRGAHGRQGRITPRHERILRHSRWCLSNAITIAPAAALSPRVSLRWPTASKQRQSSAFPRISRTWRRSRPSRALCQDHGRARCSSCRRWASVGPIAGMTQNRSLGSAAPRSR